MAATFFPFSVLALLSPAAWATAGHSTCAAAGAGESCQTVEAGQPEHEEQSLLAVRRFGPTPESYCYNYAHSFPTQFLDGAGDLTSIFVRYMVVDVETVAVPQLEGRGAEQADFFVAHNFYDGGMEKQQPGLGADQYYIMFVANLTDAEMAGSRDWTVTGLWPNAAWVSIQLQYTFSIGSTKDVSVDLALPSGLVPPHTEPPTFPGTYNEQVLVLAPNLTTTKSRGADNARRIRLLEFGPLPTPAPAPGTAAANPFDGGNPTVLTWKGQAKCAAESGRNVAGANSGAAMATVSTKPSKVKCAESNTNVYRLSGELTRLFNLPAGPDGCSLNYIVSPGANVGAALNQSAIKGYDFKYGYIRFRIPSFQNNFKETVQRGLMNDTNSEGYNLGYFSVNSQFIAPPGTDGPNLPWSVNSLMLSAQAVGSKDSSEAVILFAPPEEVAKMKREVETAPPIVHLQKLKRQAYVMYAPNFLFLFRYMGSALDWQGRPSAAACKENLPLQLKSPVTCEEQGQWKPMITRLDDVNSVEELVEAVQAA